MKKHTFLIGFMGSGKSHWGRLLASALHRPFIDLDALIEEKAGKSIAAIFAETGEAGFRELERNQLHELDNIPPAVVATGGGTPCFFDNMARMKKTGTTIYLKVRPEILVERLKKEKTQRPLLKDTDDAGLSEFIHKRLTEREPWYSQADFTLELNGGEEAFLQRFLDIASADRCQDKDDLGEI